MINKEKKPITKIVCSGMPRTLGGLDMEDVIAEKRKKDKPINDIELIEEDNQEIPIKIDNALKSRIEEQLSNQEFPIINDEIKCETLNTKEMRKQAEEYYKNLHKADNINHPSHYQGKIECIDYLQDKLSPSEFKGFLKGNVLKYLSRAGKKDDELQDLKKAKWYLEKLINNMEK